MAALEVHGPDAGNVRDVETEAIAERKRRCEKGGDVSETKADFRIPCESLLDWFAGQAMANLLNDTWYKRRADESAERVAPDLAGDAYTYADAMIAERTRRLEQAK